MKNAHLTIYAYQNCGTCKKALAYLDRKGIAYKKIPIRDQPPTMQELKRMLKYVDGNLRKLFNTSGQDYKALNLSQKLPSMRETDALTLLARNGNLVKRPFVLTSNLGWVGFDETMWEQLLSTLIQS